MNINTDIMLARLNELCAKKGIRPTVAFTESGVGKNFKSNLKTSKPSMGKITMLANYFGVTTDYLTGMTDSTTAPQTNERTELFPNTVLSEKEKRLLYAYRNRTDMRAAVDKLLGIDGEDDTVTVYTAAKSAENVRPQIIEMSKEKWEKIEQIPDTDEELL